MNNSGTRVNNDIFHGTIRVAIEEQRGLLPSQQALLKNAHGDGSNLPGTIQFQCRIATDVNKAIWDGITVNDVLYLPNPKVRAQFGRNKDGNAYLTFGLVDTDNGDAYTLHWENGDVPYMMQETAVRHDEGENVEAKIVMLPLCSAVVHETGEKGKTTATIDRRRNHDTAKDGKPYRRAARPSHDRLCSKDLKRAKVIVEQRRKEQLHSS